MQMTCEWLECIRMIGEVYILTSTWDLGLGTWDLGTAKTAKIRVIYPEVPTSIYYVVAWLRVDVYSPYRPLSDSLLKLASLVAFLCLFAL